uniref:Uncharacterized protein n=1 Tax=Saccharolobus solfataricus (strain ATCC 35092 / DSM 1617 / JCM 11322 / P2) TaxID=273057 RepID=A5GXX6_SACS2|nr:hypothetical protein [Saccharolobus solfataricus]ABA64554.1 hypothetical protein [Saccharolobus solfataricus P2]
MVTLKLNKKSEDKKDNGKKGKPIKYVYLASHKGVFLVTGEVKESKYSYGVHIIPLHGYYKAKNGTFKAKDLSDYYVILNIDKKNEDLVNAIKNAKLVVIGYKEDEVLIVERGDDNGSAKEN